MSFIWYIVIAFILYQIFNYIKFKIDSKNHVDRIPSYIPFFGNIISFAKGPLQMVKEFSKEKDVFTTHILGKELTFLTHPKDYHVFFKTTDEELGVQEVYRLMTPIFGKGLVYDAPNANVMMEQLQFVTQGINTDNFRRYAKIFEEETLEKIKTLPDEGKFNAFDTFAEIIIATASRCLLGDDIRKFIQPKELAKLYHDLDAGINPISFFFPNLTFLPGSKQRDIAKDKIFSIFKELIELRRKNPGDYGDALELLMNGTYKSGEKLPDDHICGILLGGLFAGEHTSSVTSTWTLLNILKDPQIKKEILEEQEKVLGDDHLTLEKYKNMELLQMSFKEALRLYPPIILLFRYVKKDRKLDNGKIVPKGNIIAVSPAHTGSLEEVYPNAKKFDPKRWSEKRSEHTKFPFSDLSFGAGRHKCIGENFARYQVTSILSILLQQLEFTFDSDLPKVNYESLVAMPSSDASIVSFKKKKSSK